MKLGKLKPSGKMQGHAPKNALPSGDYYGSGVRNPIGKARDLSFGSSNIASKKSKKSKPTPAA